MTGWARSGEGAAAGDTSKYASSVPPLENWEEEPDASISETDSRLSYDQDDGTGDIGSLKDAEVRNMEKETQANAVTTDVPPNDVVLLVRQSNSPQSEQTHAVPPKARRQASAGSKAPGSDELSTTRKPTPLRPAHVANTTLNDCALARTATQDGGIGNGRGPGVAVSPRMQATERRPLPVSIPRGEASHSVEQQRQWSPTRNSARGSSELFEAAARAGLGPGQARSSRQTFRESSTSPHRSAQAPSPSRSAVMLATPQVTYHTHAPTALPRSGASRVDQELPSHRQARHQRSASRSQPLKTAEFVQPSS